MKPDVQEFTIFHNLLMKEAPAGYVPHYIKCAKGGKGPGETGSWKENRLTFKEAVEWMTGGGNVGIAARRKDPLIILDFDNRDLIKNTKIKDTLFVKTRSRMLHALYFSDNGENWKNLIAKEGEVRTMNYYTVAPGSYAPVDKSDPKDVKKFEEIPESEKVDAGKYNVVNKRGLATLTHKELPDFFVVEEGKGEIQNIKQLWENTPTMGDGSDTGALILATWFRLKGYSKEDAITTLCDWWARSPDFKGADYKINNKTSKEWIEDKVDSAYKGKDAYFYEFTQHPKEFDIDGSKLKQVGGVPGIPPKRGDIFVHKYKDDEIISTKILTGVLGSFINHNYVFKTLTDTEEVFVYSEGVYVPGETLIKSECQIIIGEKLIKTNHVKEATDFIRRATFEDRDSFDLDDKLINLKNGLYDVENNQLIKHTPTYLSFIQMPIEYDPVATAPLWSKYLGNTLALDEDRMILQEVAGWVFMGGYNIQKAVLLEGGGGNGKSVYLDTVTAMLGADNVSSVSWQELGEDKYAKAQLYGKMANIHTDLSKSAITDTSAFKALTGGDKIWSDVKHSIKGINFYNRAKLVYACNQIPRSKDITDAFFDRLILINFPFKIRGTKDEDKNLKKKLIEELPGIFNWAIVGLNRLLETESFSTSKTTDDFKSIYQKKSDTVVAFFRELVRRGEKEDKETKEDVYQFYVAYCKEHLNIEPVNKQVFGAAFGKQAGWVGSGQRYVFVEKGEDSIRLSCWTNITIKDLPGKQDTIPWTGEGIVSEKSTPKKPSNTTHTIPKPPFSPTEILDSPDNPIFDKGKDIKKEISDKNRRKGIVCVDKTSQKDRVTALLGMIQSREKTFNGTVVYKSELADDYQLKKWTMAQLDEDIQTLLRDGIIYDPNNNERYKTV